MTAQTLMDLFGATCYKGLSDAMKLDLLNEVDVLIARHFGIRKRTRYYAVTENDRNVDVSAGDLWVERARWLDKPHATPGRLSGSLLTETNIDELDTSGVDWQADSPGTPAQFYQTHDEAGGQMGFDVAPDETTLVVTAATNATPIVATSSAAHGLADGDRVDIYQALVNTAANGQNYAKRTGYSTTTFALYSDEDLAVPVAGNGVYTASSGLLLCEGSPLLRLDTRYHTTLGASDNMPDTPFFKRLYVNGMAFMHAQGRHDKDLPKWRTLFEDVIGEQAKLTLQRSGRKPMRLRTVTQRPTASVARTRW